MSDRAACVGVPWGGRQPRAWQEAALPLALEAIDAGRWGVICATMGSGKSIHQAEVVASILLTLADDEVVVVTAPTKRLVRQLGATFRERLGDDIVGAFYSDAKEAGRPVIVTCNPSAAKLAVVLDSAGRRVRLWLADECHGTESDQLLEAAQALQPTTALGYTATPYRSDEKESLRLWTGGLVYKYGPGDALRDRVIVPYRLKLWEDDEIPIDDAVVAMIRQHVLDPGLGPGIVNASSIDDAEGFAHRLRGEGIRASAIHSRMTDAARDYHLAALQAGELDALVHVNLLAEGVDLPWLRWLAMRREVKARVRFAQEVGRVLRSHPGKEYAVLLDPHDLFSVFALSYEEALGWEPEEKEPAEEKEEREDDGVGATAEIPKAKRVAEVSRWSRQLLLALQNDGFGHSDFTMGRARRAEDATASQRASLKKWTWVSRWLPRAHADAVRKAHASGAVRKGEVSDLLTLLMGLRDLARAHELDRSWRWSPSVPVETIDPSTLDVPIEASGPPPDPVAQVGFDWAAIYDRWAP